MDAVVRIARENHVAISMTLFHQRYRKAITLEKARAWAELGGPAVQATRPNIVWSMTPEAKPEFVPILRELAAGLREGDGGRAPDHLQARSGPLFLQLHPQRAVAGFQLDADLDQRAS